MKKHLFYVFLFLFLATGIITILGVINAIEIKERYLDVLFGSLILELVGAVVALFKGTDFFDEKGTESKKKDISRNEEETEEPKLKEPQSEKINKKKTDSKNVNIKKTRKLNPRVSYKDYYEYLESLKNRFHEREEFINGFEGSAVSWEGYISNISGGTKSDDSILVTIKVDINNIISSLFIASFSNNFKTKLYSLNKNDYVCIKGKIKLGALSSTPYIEAQSIELISI